MHKHIFGRRFKRDTNERKALFRSLLSELVMHERIKTTEEKAKAIKADADRLITKAKKQDRIHVYAQLRPLVTTDAVQKLLFDIAPRFADRAGGYTRIVKLNRRFNDDARMVFIEWTESKKGDDLPVKGNDTTARLQATNDITTPQSQPEKTKKPVKPTKPAQKATKKPKEEKA